MGGEGEYDGRPIHEVMVPDFRIAKYPVTNGQYARFVEAQDTKRGATGHGEAAQESGSTIRW